MEDRLVKYQAGEAIWRWDTLGKCFMKFGFIVFLMYFFLMILILHELQSLIDPIKEEIIILNDKLDKLLKTCEKSN